MRTPLCKLLKMKWFSVLSICHLSFINQLIFTEHLPGALLDANLSEVFRCPAIETDKSLKINTQTGRERKSSLCVQDVLISSTLPMTWHTLPLSSSYCRVLICGWKRWLWIIISISSCKLVAHSVELLQGLRVAFVLNPQWFL